MVEYPAIKVNEKENSFSESTANSKTNYSSFLNFAACILPQSAKHTAITSAYRLPETQLLPILLSQAQLAESQNQAVYQLAKKLREQKNSLGRSGLVQGLLQEFASLHKK